MLTPAAAFLITAALIVYVLAGYPLLLGALARWRPRPVRKGDKLRPVSVVIAVYNGERFIGPKLDSVLALDYPGELLDITVVSDGSTDATDRIVSGFAPRGVALIRVPRGGKAAALNVGIRKARGELLLLTDVRQTLAPDSLRRLVACFEDERVGVASGEMLIRDSRTMEEAHVGLYWRYESWMRRRLAAIDSIFGATGPFYAMRRCLAVEIPPDILLDDVYLPLHAFFRGYRLVVEPSARAYDYATSLETEFRRKVRTLAGNYQIILAFPGLLGPANRMWLHFVSYKLGRLLLPYALIALAVETVLLPAPWAALATAGQAAFYGLAVVDRWIPEGFPLKRLSSPVRTFVVLMVASLSAVAVFFVPPRTLWKETKVA